MNTNYENHSQNTNNNQFINNNNNNNNNCLVENKHKLPEELIYKIINYVEDGESFVALLSTCRQFRRICYDNLIIKEKVKIVIKNGEKTNNNTFLRKHHPSIDRFRIQLEQHEICAEGTKFGSEVFDKLLESRSDLKEMFEKSNWVGPNPAPWTYKKYFDKQPGRFKEFMFSNLLDSEKPGRRDIINYALTNKNPVQLEKKHIRLCIRKNRENHLKELVSHMGNTKLKINLSILQLAISTKNLNIIEIITNAPLAKGITNNIIEKIPPSGKDRLNTLKAIELISSKKHLSKNEQTKLNNKLNEIKKTSTEEEMESIQAIESVITKKTTLSNKKRKYDCLS